jgi:hypothetical protein
VQRSIIAPAERVTNLRWGIALLLAGALLVQSFSIELIGSPSAIGWLFVLAVTLVAGPLVDRFGTLRMGQAGLAGIVLVLLAACGHFGAGVLPALSKLAAVPFALAAVKAVGYWFPTSERNGAAGLLISAAALGLATATAPGSESLPGSPSALAAVAGVVVLCFVAYSALYRDPSHHRSLTHAEGEFLRSGDAQPEGRTPNARTPLGLLARRKTWGLLVAAGALGFVFATPWSMDHAQLLGPIHHGMIHIPAQLWLAFAGSAVVAGFLADALIRRGTDATLVRRWSFAAGLTIGAISIFAGAHHLAHEFECSALGAAGLGFAVPSLIAAATIIASAGTVGTLAALATFAGGAMTIVPPWFDTIIDLVEQSLGITLIAAAGIIIAGILSFVFILGRIEPPPEISA